MRRIPTRWAVVLAFPIAYLAYVAWQRRDALKAWIGNVTARVTGRANGWSGVTGGRRRPDDL